MQVFVEAEGWEPAVQRHCGVRPCLLSKAPGSGCAGQVGQGQLLAGERGQGQLCSWGVLRQEDISALPLSFCCTAFIRGSILL